MWFPKRFGVGSGQISTHREVPISLFRILGSLQKVLLQQKFLQLTKICIPFLVCDMHFPRLCFNALGLSKVITYKSNHTEILILKMIFVKRYMVL